MIKEIETGDEKVLGWRLEGKIDEAEYTPVLDALQQKVKTSDHVSIYMEVPKMPGVTAQTVWESLKFGFSNMKEFIKSLDRVAVVTDKEWIKNYTAIESRLLPGVEEKGFSFEDAEKAKQWVRGV